MYEKILRQTKYWRYAAWTLPFVALGLLVALDVIGAENYKDIASIAVVCVFFGCSVFWWWWAMDAIHTIFQKHQSTEQDFIEIKTYIKETKELVEQDVSNRQRRK